MLQLLILGGGIKLEDQIETLHWRVLRGNEDEEAELGSQLSFHHVGLAVRDVVRSRDFYTRVLGFAVQREKMTTSHRIVFLQGGGVTIELLERLGRPAGQGFGLEHIAFQVPDIRVAISSLRRAGVDLGLEKNDPDPQPREVEGGLLLFFFQGPDGETIEFSQRPVVAGHE